MEILDARGLLCPMPVIRVQDQVARMQPGEVLQAVCSDPGVLNDIPAWCRLNGHIVLDTEDNGAEQKVTLKVGTDKP